MIRRSGLTRTSGYSQKLPDTYKSTDITDDQSIKTLPPSFDIMKKGKPFSLERPSFKKATASAIVDESISTFNIARLNKRTGLGNNTLLRDSFRTPDVLGRQATDFALQELLDQQQQGIKVQLSDKTLNDMFQVKTVDPDDKAWIAEYNRRLAGGETKDQLKTFPPFGREQRVMFKRINLGEGVSLSELSSKTITEQITILKDAVTGGSSTSDLPNIMAKIMELYANFESFTDENAKMLAEILNASGAISPDPAIHFGKDYHRIWSVKQIMESSKFLPFIQANVPNAKYPSLSVKEPVINDGKGRITLATMFKLLNTGVTKPVYNSDGQRADPMYKAYDYYLDVNERTVITRDKVIALVTGVDNVDNGMIDGLPPPPVLVTGGMPVAGKWNLDAENADLESKASTKKP